jgi:tetratricopeptide (TPR) repeat protein
MRRPRRLVSFLAAAGGLVLWAAALLAGSLVFTFEAQAATAAALFATGNDAYDDGRYEEAVSAYQQILSRGLLDPRVYYNLGNAYFKLGRLGPAILHYERALRLSPEDREARHNLDLARGQIRDRVAEPELQYPIRVVKEAIDRLPPNPLAWFFLVSYVALAGLIALHIVSRSWTRRRAIAYVSIFVGLLALTAGTALVYKVRQMSSEVAVVMQDKVDVRSGPGEDNTILFTVHEGTRLEMRNRLQAWVQVGLPNGLSGWVPATALEQV